MLIAWFRVSLFNPCLVSQTFSQNCYIRWKQHALVPRKLCLFVSCFYSFGEPLALADVDLRNACYMYSIILALLYSWTTFHSLTSVCLLTTFGSRLSICYRHIKRPLCWPTVFSSSGQQRGILPLRGAPASMGPACQRWKWTIFRCQTEIRRNVAALEDFESGLILLGRERGEGVVMVVCTVGWDGYVFWKRCINRLLSGYWVVILFGNFQHKRFSLQAVGNVMIVVSNFWFFDYSPLFSMRLCPNFWLLDTEHEAVKSQWWVF